MKYQFRPAALRDLSQIWAYTANQWSIAQADRYISEITKKIENATKTTQAGSPVAGFQYDYRKLSIGAHHIYYRLVDGKMLVVRILHERMDVVAALS